MGEFLFNPGICLKKLLIEPFPPQWLVLFRHQDGYRQCDQHNRKNLQHGVPKAGFTVFHPGFPSAFENAAGIGHHGENAKKDEWKPALFGRHLIGKEEAGHGISCQRNKPEITIMKKPDDQRGDGCQEDENGELENLVSCVRQRFEKVQFFKSETEFPHPCDKLLMDHPFVQQQKKQSPNGGDHDAQPCDASGFRSRQ